MSEPNKLQNPDFWHPLPSLQAPQPRGAALLTRLRLHWENSSGWIKASNHQHGFTHRQMDGLFRFCLGRGNARSLVCGCFFLHLGIQFFIALCDLKTIPVPPWVLFFLVRTKNKRQLSDYFNLHTGWPTYTLTVTEKTPWNDAEHF